MGGQTLWHRLQTGPIRTELQRQNADHQLWWHHKKCQAHKSKETKHRISYAFILYHFLFVWHEPTDGESEFRHNHRRGKQLDNYWQIGRPSKQLSRPHLSWPHLPDHQSFCQASSTIHSERLKSWTSPLKLVFLFHHNCLCCCNFTATNCLKTTHQHSRKTNNIQVRQTHWPETGDCNLQPSHAAANVHTSGKQTHTHILTLFKVA